MNMPPDLPAVEDLRTIELCDDHAVALQAFYDANPAYFLAVNGEPARPSEAHEDLHEELPAGLWASRQLRLAWLDSQGAMVAMASLVEDLMAAGVCHIGLFIVATEHHGSGLATRLCTALEAWASRRAARWMRLGVVLGHERAERFWRSRGFVELRQRHGLQMGRRVNTVRVMLKPLGAASIADYLALVARDRPDDAAAPAGA